MIFLTVLGVRIQVKYIPSLLHSNEEKNIRTLNIGIQNDNKYIIKLIFTAFVDIIVNI